VEKVTKLENFLWKQRYQESSDNRSLDGIFTLLLGDGGLCAPMNSKAVPVAA
jgi:hypothetical protein